MISNDKILVIQLTYACFKKKLNVHGKYKFNYVHYVIDETNWDEIWPSQITKPIKITLAVET
ncbi:hypothetical protein [Mycoplasmopsis bovis]|uniref:hypothetical protein n=1 Tax=Mycoplasmopsis bovis TaxID=28903 RepID=UPI001CF2E7DF|nr:hypothetical protein [Mycoplasmopsis bovis]UCP05852.1 hypothetical protein JNG56_04315 [Mycoplasmopsis bovis]